MTYKEQIDDAEAEFNNKREKLLLIEKEDIDTLTSKLMLLFAGIYGLSYYEQNRRKAEAKKIIFGYHKKMVDDYLDEYKIGKTEKILGYTVDEMLYSINNTGYKNILSDIKNKKFDLEKTIDYFEYSGKRRTVKETLNGYIYEQSKNNETSIYGWISVAVLDKRTSNICRELDGKFYSAEDYKLRENIPNRPPRHFRCRSIIVKVNNREEVDKILTLN